MKLPDNEKRRYDSTSREKSAARTHARILDCAREAFSERGIDAVTIAEIAAKAGVSPSGIYAVFKSKVGILAELMEAAMFGANYQTVRARFDGVTDPVEMIASTAQIARAIYEGEESQLGQLRGLSAFSPALHEIEQRFEAMRLDFQRQRVAALFASGRQRVGLTEDEARRVLWMYTSRDVYRMMVRDAGWSGDRFEEWLAGTLVEALVRA